MCGWPLGFKSFEENFDGRFDRGHVFGLKCGAMTAGPCVDGPERSRVHRQKIGGGSKAVMCPALSCGNMTAGPDRFRERHPNRWAVFIYHGPARILSFVGSTDHYLLLRP
jgi:hypothetical protein